MRLLKIWPALISILVCGCSLQHHTDRAERIWLNASSLNNALHSVSLDADVLPGDKANTKQSFFTASGASTHLRGKIQSPQIRELSGIAPVLGERDKYWAINDSGNRAQLFAVDGNGRHLGAIDLAINNRDWEDLSSYTYKGENWIALAETGDNLQRYPVSYIYIFKQPDINSLPTRLAPFQRIAFTYEDGPTNVESMAVSASEGRIYLIAKDGSEPGIYSLPLIASVQAGTSKLIASRTGQLANLFPTSDDVWWERLFAARILFDATAADISADDRTAVVANYRHVYLFKRRGDETWADAFSRKPEILSSHRMQQSEAVAFSAQTDEVVVSSEGVEAPLLAVRPSSQPGISSALQ